jgi:predicted GTPase
VTNSIVIVNKIDVARREQVLKMLGAASELGAAAYFPVSAVTGEGIGRWSPT